MSEEKLNKLTEEYLLKEKISELEKKLEEGKNHVLDYVTPRIEKLEDSLQKCGVKWDFRLDEHSGFINELKDVKNCQLWGVCENQWVEIAELKEQFKNLKLSVDDNNTWIVENDNIREVLRDDICKALMEMGYDAREIQDKLGGEQSVYETSKMKGPREANLGMKVIKSDSKPSKYPNPDRCRICRGVGTTSFGGKLVDIKFHNEVCLGKEPTIDRQTVICPNWIFGICSIGGEIEGDILVEREFLSNLKAYFSVYDCKSRYMEEIEKYLGEGK